MIVGLSCGIWRFLLARLPDRALRVKYGRQAGVARARNLLTGVEVGRGFGEVLFPTHVGPGMETAEGDPFSPLPPTSFSFSSLKFNLWVLQLIGNAN